PRVVHVGMWIGERRFIHASGEVRISSVDPGAAAYDAYEVGRYLATRRIARPDGQPAEGVTPLSVIFR
ncbi:MAG: glycoside hydrolase, partial [Catalinimonas sp.]